MTTSKTSHLKIMCNIIVNKKVLNYIYSLHFQSGCINVNFCFLARFNFLQRVFIKGESWDVEN